ncbi:MAG: hypothetical protein ACLUIQ_04655 [Dialister invisus]
MLAPAVDYEELFAKSEFQGKKLFLFSMGTVTFPTGKIIVCDPLVYLDKNAVPYRRKFLSERLCWKHWRQKWKKEFSATLPHGSVSLRKKRLTMNWR